MSMWYLQVVVTVCASVYMGQASMLLGRCDNGDVVYNCSGVGLTEIPGEQYIPTHSRVLQLAHNNIHNITELKYKSLENTLLTLNLSDNHLTILDTYAFKDLTHLETLDLSSNLLVGSSIEGDVFYGLDRLHKLHLSTNPWRTIKTDTFSFMQLPALEYLHLSHCEISVIENSGIDIPNLISLDLSWNKLQSFTDDGFKMLTSLKTLDLSHNQIRVLDMGASMFPFLPDLLTLNLDSNGLEEVHIGEGNAYYTESLENLFLRNNEIIRFGPEALPLEADTIRVLDLSDNHIQCDCRMKWIAQQNLDIKDKQITIKCRYPSSVKGDNLLSLDEDHLTCKLPPAKIIFIVSVGFLCVCLLGMVVFMVVRRRRRGRSLLRRPGKGDNGGDYTAVYTREEEDVTVTMSDSKALIDKDREFDV